MLMQAGQHGAFVVRFCGLSTLIALVRRLQQIVGQVHGTAFRGGGLVSRKGRKAPPEFYSCIAGAALQPFRDTRPLPQRQCCGVPCAPCGGNLTLPGAMLGQFPA
ncbi:hypothetical protein DMX11_17290 [Pseudomonas sp. LB-090624]|nr:hypothetical protein DMX11_17290 [Pseudomonas sp. LB-090624]